MHTHQRDTHIKTTHFTAASINNQIKSGLLPFGHVNFWHSLLVHNVLIIHRHWFFSYPSNGIFQIKVAHILLKKIPVIITITTISMWLDSRWHDLNLQVLQVANSSVLGILGSSLTAPERLNFPHIRLGLWHLSLIAIYTKYLWTL